MTAATDNPWAILDDLIGISGAKHLTDKQGTQSAFYGRCSTEDNQDPKTSRAWQREKSKARAPTLPISSATIQASSTGRWGIP